MNGRRSDYTFAVVEILGDSRANQIVQIVDQDLGNVSVTNDIENILNEIQARLPGHPTAYVWIYRDSMETWDEVVVDDVGNFVKFKALPRGRCFTEIQAAAIAQFQARHKEAQAPVFGSRPPA